MMSKDDKNAIFLINNNNNNVLLQKFNHIYEKTMKYLRFLSKKKLETTERNFNLNCM